MSHGPEQSLGEVTGQGHGGHDARNRSLTTLPCVPAAAAAAAAAGGGPLLIFQIISVFYKMRIKIASATMTFICLSNKQPLVTAQEPGLDQALVGFDN